MAMKVGKGVESLVSGPACVGHMPAKDNYEREGARVFYVKATLG